MFIDRSSENMRYYYNIDDDDNNNNNVNVNIDEAAAEAEETLSLCDLVTTTHDHNDATEWEDFSISQSSSSILSSQEDLFEFFNEDWSTNSISCPPENIIFCGKQIAYKQQPVSSETVEKFGNKQATQAKVPFDGINLDSFSITKNPKANCYLTNRNERISHDNSSSSSSSTSPKQTQNKNRFGNSYDLSVQKMSILTSPSKSRWYLLLLGIARVPTRMELRSIKSRQSRQSPSSTPLFQTKESGYNHEMNACSKLSKGLWEVIRAIGCVRHHHATAITTSIRSVPRRNSYLD